MKDCTGCNKRKYCKQAYRIRLACDAEGRPYILDEDSTLYNFVARAYNHESKQYEIFKGNIKIPNNKDFALAIAAHLRGINDHVWLCAGAKRLS